MEQEAESRTLFMGDLESSMDEAFLHALIDQLNYKKELVAIKMIKDKTTGQLTKYCFFEFVSRDSAAHFLSNYNRQLIPNTNKLFTLKWAARGARTKTKIYVGNLQTHTTQQRLLELFPGAVSATVIREGGVTKYGFVYFTREEDAATAIAQGARINGRALKVCAAHIKRDDGETETQASHRIGLYKEFYSLASDLRGEYEKQLNKTFAEKQTLKQSLEAVKTYSLIQTMASQGLLEDLPRVRAARAKAEIQAKIFC